MQAKAWVDAASMLLVGALALYSLTLIEPPFAFSQAGIVTALIWGAATAVVIYSAGTVDSSGAVAGFIGIGLIHLFVGVGGVLVALAFFVLATAATKYKWDHKEGHYGGKRSAKHAVANCVVPGYFGFLAYTTPHASLFSLAYVASFAAATADTLSGELGQLINKHPVMITNFERTKPGVDGAISWQGTLLGLVAGALVALLGAGSGIIAYDMLWVVVAASLAGNLVDSLLGATVERKKYFSNETVNFYCTLVGGLSAIALVLWF